MTSRMKARKLLKVLLEADAEDRETILLELHAQPQGHSLALRLCHVAGIRRVRGNALRVLERRIKRLNLPSNVQRKWEVLYG